MGASRGVLCSGIALLAAAGALAQEARDGSPQKPPLTRYAVSPASSEIEIDGRLDEPAWQTAVRIDLPYEWRPGENVAPPVGTDCFVTFDAEYLYVGFDARDPEPEKIRAHLMDRDQIDTLVQDDYVGFMLDSYDDQRRAFQFRINPLGVQAEALNSSLSEDWEWDILWDSAGRITGNGFVVEVAVPFNQLRFPAGDRELTFGFQAMRSWPRSVRHRIASNLTDFDDSCMMCQFAKLSGFRGMSLGRNLELTPTLTSSRTDRREDLPGGGLVEGDLEADPGLGLRWGLTPNFTLNATLNPDFSQVEADVAQLEVNERFALFFPETRPFFLESADYFDTPIDAVFTRTVANPRLGGKLTGKLGANALGVFVTRDRINNLLLPSNQTSAFDSVDDETTTGILRYRRDVGRSSTLGGLYAGREGSDYHNRVFGVDGTFQVAPADTVQVQYLHSETRYPETVALRQDQDLGTLGGDALNVEYLHFTRGWLWNARYEDLSPGFRADSGFVPRVDTRTVNLFLQRRWWGEPESVWTSINLGAEYGRTQDHDGRLTDRFAGLNGRIEGPLQSSLSLLAYRTRQLFGAEAFELDELLFTLEAQPSGALKLVLRGQLGDGLDTFNVQKGDRLSLRPRLELKLGRHLNLSLAHSHQRLEVPGGRLFREDLSELRFVYHLNVRTFARLILQHRDVQRDARLFPFEVEPGERDLFVQLLASYKLNPRTVVFLGYSDNRQGRGGLSLSQTDRTFFVKLGYAWSL